MLRVASSRAHTVTGPVYGALAAIDRDSALILFDDVARASVHAASLDRSHRWADGVDEGADAGGSGAAESSPADSNAGEEPTYEP